MTEQRAPPPLPPQTQTRAVGGPAPFPLLDLARPFLCKEAKHSSYPSTSPIREAGGKKGRHASQVSQLQRSLRPNLALLQPNPSPTPAPRRQLTVTTIPAAHAF